MTVPDQMIGQIFVFEIFLEEIKQGLAARAPISFRICAGPVKGNPVYVSGLPINPGRDFVLKRAALLPPLIALTIFMIGKCSMYCYNGCNKPAPLLFLILHVVPIPTKALIAIFNQALYMTPKLAVNLRHQTAKVILSKNMKFLICLFLLLASATANAQDTAPAFIYEPIFEPALDYTKIPLMNDCKEERPGRTEYHRCRNSQKIYDAAKKNAQAKNQPLMVLFGFDTCPSCAVLHRQIFDPKRPMETRDIIQFFSVAEINERFATNKPLKISVVRIHARSKHGLKLADDLGVTKMANDRGWYRVWSPFLLLVNPHTGKMHSESYWESKEGYCNYPTILAVSIEGVGMTKPGKPYQERKRCKY